MKRIVPEQRKRKKRDATMRIGAGAVEIVKRGAAVAKIVKGGERLRSQMFAELQSHYLFADRLSYKIDCGTPPKKSNAAT